ncbi:MAG: hypothetical protein LBU10_03030 [Endomicrobium sp.]|nr:hypothetical protein [Endomicrobium sp.]
MKNIIKNYHCLNFIVAIIIAISILFNILAISILESSDAISLKSSDTVVLNLGGGLLKVYKSINIPVIKITSIFGLCVYENNLISEELAKCCRCFFAQNGNQQKADKLINSPVMVLPLNSLSKVCRGRRSFCLDINDSFNFYFLKNREFIRFILLFLILMLVLPRGIPKENLHKIIKSNIITITT